MLQRSEPRLILASASLSRRTLLAAAGLQFEVVPAPVDEAEIKRTARAAGMSAADTALALADRKASHVAGRNQEALVIGADQILVCEGAWFDKPSDREAARGQLNSFARQFAYPDDWGRVSSWQQAGLVSSGRAVSDDAALFGHFSGVIPARRG